ncbi:hypothetical protein IFM89_011083 [Coptis chinensis]|uniref:Uncharacterized protein n=1 Tax=Coptis chinensis TaxID=261450 RepID=A0A835M5F4_9MAGN|nr:hypothetical protein IFM89_011083 [Coptis chinensis]
MVKVTSDHHEEVIKVGISPSLKESVSFQKFLYVIAGYPGDVREDIIMRSNVTYGMQVVACNFPMIVHALVLVGSSSWT